MFVLAVNCQRDESADIDADRGLPSTEVSPRQLQDRAREIVNSEEYRENTIAIKSFFDKIHNRGFFTKDLFDLENEAYNYDVINERLSGTSFSSTEEFISEYEKLFYSFQKLVTKHPSLINSLVQEKIINVEEDIMDLREINEQKRLLSSKSYKCEWCKNQCANTFNRKRSRLVTEYRSAIIACGFSGIISLTGPLGTSVCFVGAWYYFDLNMGYLRNDYDRCITNCNWGDDCSVDPYK